MGDLLNCPCGRLAGTIEQQDKVLATLDALGRTGAGTLEAETSWWSGGLHPPPAAGEDLRTGYQNPSSDNSMPKLIFDGDKGGGVVYPIALERTTIGRGGQNTLTIPHPSVSSVHCEILAHRSEIILRDLGSRNGTFLNGHCLRAQQRPLKHGDVVGLGDVEARLDMADLFADGTDTDVTAVHAHARYVREQHEDKAAPPDHTDLGSDTGNVPPTPDHTLRLTPSPQPAPLPRKETGSAPPGYPRHGIPWLGWVVATLLAVGAVVALWQIFGDR